MLYICLRPTLHQAYIKCLSVSLLEDKVLYVLCGRSPIILLMVTLATKELLVETFFIHQITWL